MGLFLNLPAVKLNLKWPSLDIGTYRGLVNLVVLHFIIPELKLKTLFGKFRREVNGLQLKEGTNGVWIFLTCPTTVMERLSLLSPMLFYDIWEEKMGSTDVVMQILPWLICSLTRPKISRWVSSFPTLS